MINIEKIEQIKEKISAYMEEKMGLTPEECYVVSSYTSKYYMEEIENQSSGLVNGDIDVDEKEDNEKSKENDEDYPDEEEDIDGIPPPPRMRGRPKKKINLKPIRKKHNLK